MNLKDVPTIELIAELKSRQNVQTFKSKSYNGYNVNIVKKFSEDRTSVRLPVNNTVLVIKKLGGDEMLNKNLENKVGEKAEDQENEYPLCECCDAYRQYLEETYPIAEEIVNILVNKGISYAKACEALSIAKEGLKTLVIK